jgi:5-methylcytosine-specific restriction endonuclease McrA
VRGPVGNARLASVARLTKEEWQAIKPAVLPLLRSVQPRILESLNYIRTFDGQRLPSADWHIVRSIVMERDRYSCIYCGSDKQLEADHILPLGRGGSNAFANLATACRPCNLSKGSKTVEDWGDRNARLGLIRPSSLSATWLQSAGCQTKRLGDCGFKSGLRARHPHGV